MHDLDVTVSVTNVNERPVADTAIADQTMTVGVSRIISLQGTFSDPDGDTLTYSASISPSGIATVSLNDRDSTLTIAALTAGRATITVTAADRRSSTDADRLAASQNFAVTVEASLPTVTISRHPDTDLLIDEGDPATFRLVAAPAPTANLAVRVRIAETRQGAFLHPDESLTRSVTIRARRTTADFTIRTLDDTEDEHNEGITVEIVPDDTRYVLGDSIVASVRVLDGDQPDPPAELRANGDLDSDGNVKLRWLPILGATGYGVRYIEERCNSDDGVCDTHGSWQTPKAANLDDNRPDDRWGRRETGQPWRFGRRDPLPHTGTVNSCERFRLVRR